MSLAEIIESDARLALKNKDQVRLSALRMLKASLKNKEVALRRKLSDAEVINIIGAQIKMRRESIEIFQPAGRTDLVEKEEAELNILSAYCPAPLSRKELELEVKRIIQETSATGLKDLGKVMKVAMSQLEGKAEGKVISEIVKSYLV